MCRGKLIGAALALMTASAAFVREAVADGDIDSSSKAADASGIACPADEFEDDIKALKVGFAYVDVGGVVSGIQIGSINETDQGCNGVQIGILGNSFHNGYLNGLQIAGLKNEAEVCDGLQFSLVLNGAGICNGLQTAVGLNWADVLNGIQFAIFANYAEVCNGLQVSLLANMSNEFINSSHDKPVVRGAQLCPLLNTSVRCDGLQACILFNQVEVLHGLQLGLCNRADRGAGVQIGLINEFAGRTMPLLNFHF